MPPRETQVKLCRPLHHEHHAASLRSFGSRPLRMLDAMASLSGKAPCPLVNGQDNLTSFKFCLSRKKK